MKISASISNGRFFAGESNEAKTAALQPRDFEGQIGSYRELP